MTETPTLVEIVKARSTIEASRRVADLGGLVSPLILLEAAEVLAAALDERQDRTSRPTSVYPHIGGNVSWYIESEGGRPDSC